MLSAIKLPEKSFQQKLNEVLQSIQAYKEVQLGLEEFTEDNEKAYKLFVEMCDELLRIHQQVSFKFSKASGVSTRMGFLSAAYKFKDISLQWDSAIGKLGLQDSDVLYALSKLMFEVSEHFLDDVFYSNNEKIKQDFQFVRIWFINLLAANLRNGSPSNHFLRGLDLKIFSEDDATIKFIESLSKIAYFFLKKDEKELACKYVLKAFEIGDVVDKVDILMEAFSKATFFADAILKKYPNEFLPEEVEAIKNKKPLSIAEKKHLITANPSDFIKTRQHFNDKQIELKKEELRRVVNLWNKKPKATPPSEFASGERDTKKWFTVTEKKDDVGYNDLSINEIILFCGELSRFLLPQVSPKFRRSPDNKFSVSSEVKDAHDIQKVYDLKKAELEKLQLSRLMSSVFIRYIFLDDDMNGGNILIEKINDINVAVNIDLERYFAPLSLRLYGDCFATEPKKTNYDDKLKEIVGKDNAYLGEMTARDYVSFPRIVDQVPYNWDFNDKDKALTTNYLIKQAQGEKHFIALKTILFQPLALDLLDIHVPTVRNKVCLRKYLSSRLQKLEKICAEDTDFKEFLIQYKTQALKTFLYELKEGFLSNRHYQYDWNGIVDNLTQHYSDIWQKVTGKALQKKEVQDIKRYATSINNCSPSAYKLPEKFYAENNMFYDVEVTKSIAEKCKAAKNRHTMFAKQDTMLAAATNIRGKKRKLGM